MRIPVFAALVAASFLIPVPDAGAAPDPTAEHKRVYAQINDDLGRMTKKTFELDFPGAPVPPQATVWMENGLPRKVQVIYPDDHGSTGEAYYLKPVGDGVQVLFVYAGVTTQAVDGGNSTLREHRYYFRDGQMFRWLDENKTSVPQNTDEFKAKEQELLDTLSTVLESLSPPKSGGKPAGGPIKETTGTFAGFEEGDYTYLHLRAGGEEHSFMILRTDDALERLLNAPERYMGKKITVTWQNTMETIPEAGGRIEVTKVLSVTLPK
ncbi:hypothetical protein [Magnetospirillum gryphiswaldense]|uniref:Secreted protein n=1 Tax=Magnetospirillum gryphiswaldense TaxID=55518 RepID=A4TYG4_9PROT|nr:hypothetical protein [Magnetospirillum gryphiswaldense]AVM75091.1 hypothetical protein MSR1_26110 [Magnetospirillum gryphiswaldense MSR-1]AVM78994.1 hypothetical protein MSR1L_26110 [Magnetospirillum gryphiswaldense]CAM75671.1 secreted protein [Magnetospirillum gryphiswaldense MSR-1]